MDTSGFQRQERHMKGHDAKLKRSCGRPTLSVLLVLSFLFIHTAGPGPGHGPGTVEAFAPSSRVPTRSAGGFVGSVPQHPQNNDLQKQLLWNTKNGNPVPQWRGHSRVGVTKSGRNARGASQSATELAALSSMSMISASACVHGLSSVCGCLSRGVQYGVTTFLADWTTFSLIPIIAAFVGWFTNYLAVQMIFYPLEWRGIPIRRVEGEPLGLFGWQGIVPAKTEKMSLAMVNTTINELLSIEEVIQRLDPHKVATILMPEVPKIVTPFVDSLIPKPFQPSVNRVIASNDWEPVQRLKRNFLMQLTKDVQTNILDLVNLRACVVKQMMADKSLLGRLFQKTGGQELSFLIKSGVWFGFLLGIIQMLVALYWDNPWTLSVGGCIVGLATNWLALKWIFEPVTPTKVGPITLQGLFLRRQPQVSTDFANFFSTKILNSRQLWNSILTDPTTAPVFTKIFAKNCVDLVKSVSRGLVNTVGETTMVKVNAASTITTANLLQYLTNLHEYVDDALAIEQTLYTEMVAMSSERFERVLHPIFEEDETTLILAGAFLGFLAGLATHLETVVSSLIQRETSEQREEAPREKTHSERVRRKCRILILRPALESTGRAGSKGSISKPFRQTVQDEMATSQQGTEL
eukprot:scaffold36122_cov67-Attheya_sp.AAC.1